MTTVPSSDGDAFDVVLAEVRNVRGWMTDAQARRLWDRASEISSDGQIVEIGSFQGRSTTVLARAATPGAGVTAIDPHAGNDRGPQEIAGHEVEADADHRAFHDNLGRAGVDDRVRHCRKFSRDALLEVDGDIELLYIDGAHRYRPARDDISSWGDRVSLGGTMLIHDCFNAVGVVGAQARLLALSSTFRYIGRSGSLAEYRREDQSGGGRLRNLLHHVKEVPYTIKNQLIKVLIVLGLGRFTRLLGNPAGDWPY